VLASRRFRSVRAKFIIDANEQLTSLGRLQVPNFTKRAILDVPLVDVRRPVRPDIGCRRLVSACVWSLSLARSCSRLIAIASRIGAGTLEHDRPILRDVLIEPYAGLRTRGQAGECGHAYIEWPAP
jgi:hypothetical protein